MTRSDFIRSLVRCTTSDAVDRAPRRRLLCAVAALLSGFGAGLAHAANPPSYDAYQSEGPAVHPSVEAPKTQVTGFVAARDDRRGVPTFVWAATNDQPDYSALPVAEAARRHLEGQAERYGLDRAAVAAAEVAAVHDLGHGGIVVTFRQRPGGVELFRVAAKVLMTRQHTLVALTGNLHAGARADLATSAAFKLDARTAVANALGDLYSVPIVASEVVDLARDNGPFHFYDVALGASFGTTGPRLVRPAAVKRIWFALPDRLVPAYYLELISKEGPNVAGDDSYAYVIAADDGRMLYRHSLAFDAQYNYRVWAEPTGNHRPLDGPLADFSPHPSGVPDGSYPAFLAPNLVANDGFNIHADPWLPLGATQSRGNNVDAYTDDGSPDGFSNGGDIRATTTGFGEFDRAYDFGLGPTANDTQRMAAITALFYLVNWFHDDWYDSGFDEAAGNAQQDNYGRGGLGNDTLHAEAQDSAATQSDNANMSASADGISPRLQIYLWTGRSSASVAAQPLNQTYPSGGAGFGPQGFSLTGDVAVVNDGQPTVTNACEPILNDVSGKIALIDRGTCTFKRKAVNAETAGAIGVILVDNQGGEPPPFMPDGNPPGNVNIPMLSISLADGNALKAALQNGAVSATLNAVIEPMRDGDLDSTLVFHELGHYLHLRQVPCGSQQCGAESEGWGDFVAMHLVVRPGDDLNGSYAMTPYAAGAMSDPGYYGLRRYPYSLDLGRNPLTFGHITSGVALPGNVPQSPSSPGVDNAEVHNAGEVWCAMVYQAYGGLLGVANGPNPPYTPDQARRRMADYVVAGMKLAPENPTYTEQRDAVLAAAFAADTSDMALLAQGFATRGAGSCAVSPPRDSTDLSGVVESFALAPQAVIASVHLDDSVVSCDADGRLDSFEQGKLVIDFMNGGVVPLVGASVSIDTTGSSIALSGATTIQLPDIGPLAHTTLSFDAALIPAPLARETDTFTVHVTAPGACQTDVVLSTSEVVNADEVVNGAADDDVEASASAWVPSGNGGTDVWARQITGVGDHAWLGIDYPAPSDTALVSPELSVSPSANFTVTFTHRFQFEQSNGTNFDGGVIEISTDHGANWADISTIVTPAYLGQIGDFTSGATNVLKGRQGYVGESPGFPATTQETLDLGTALAGQSVMIRFRIGTDEAAGASGWELDDFTFGGITNTPFTVLRDDAGDCQQPPVANAGPDETVAALAAVTLDGSASTDPDGSPLSFTWQQSAGSPAVALGGDTTATPAFTAPEVSAPTELTFTLTVSDGQATASDSVVITVNPGTGAPPDDSAISGGGCGCELAGRTSNGSGRALLLLGAVLGLGFCRRRRTPGA